MDGEVGKCMCIKAFRCWRGTTSTERQTPRQWEVELWTRGATYHTDAGAEGMGRDVGTEF